MVLSILFIRSDSFLLSNVTLFDLQGHTSLSSIVFFILCLRTMLVSFNYYYKDREKTGVYFNPCPDMLDGFFQLLELQRLNGLVFVGSCDIDSRPRILVVVNFQKPVFGQLSML